MRFALEKVFADKTDLILDIISATPHPEVAAEMLLGVYQRPHLEGTDTKQYDGHGKTNIRFTKFMDMEQSVAYEFNPVTKKQGWVKKGTQNPTEADVVTTLGWAEDACKKAGLKESDFKEQYEYVVYETTIHPTRTMEVIAFTQWLDYTSSRWKEIAEETMFEE